MRVLYGIYAAGKLSAGLTEQSLLIGGENPIRQMTIEGNASCATLVPGQISL